MGIFSDFISLLYPRPCLACSGPLVRGEEILCSQCLSDLPKTNSHHFDFNAIDARFAGRLPVKQAWAFLTFRKGGLVQHLLHQLKYNNHPEIGIALGRMFGHEITQYGFDPFDLIVPVPLHESRKRKRGYNQSAKLAEGLSDSLGSPWSETVAVRNVGNATQTRLSRSDRWKNVRDVFQVAAEGLMGKRILLVDDIITTGATLEACGQRLVDAGCAALSVACLAEAS